jgi:Family of unknown function (DUF6131)
MGRSARTATWTGILHDYPRPHSAYHGFIAKIAVLWTIGIIVLVIGLILLLGSIGRGVGGRRHYW